MTHIECPLTGCSFYCEFPGELAQHEIVHEEWYAHEASDVERDRLARFAEAQLEKLLIEAEREQQAVRTRFHRLYRLTDAEDAFTELRAAA